MTYCYLNGKIVEQDPAGVALWDIGLLRGYGVFDGMRTFNGQVFHFPDHWQRLERSARRLGLKVPLNQGEAQRILHQLLQKNGQTKADVSIRVILTGGVSPDGIGYNPQTPTFFILIKSLVVPDQQFYDKGTNLFPYEYLRFLPEVKSLNYLPAILLQPELNLSGSVEPLYFWDNKLLEAATSNFFLFFGNTLVTPKDNILLGITRKVVLALARKLKIPCEQRPVALSELKQATEAFITASYKDVLPIVRVGSEVIGNGQVGLNTRKLMEAFNTYANSGHYNLK